MKKFTVPVLIAILVLGAWLRAAKLDTWPREGATFDEYAWTFLGVSILNGQTPTSWSPHKAYTNTREYFNPKGAHFRLVTPYLEHPPLFGIIAGAYAKANGVDSFDGVTVGKIRGLALILGVAAIAMVYLLTSSLYGTGTALLASGIYAVTPSVVAGSRLVQNENFFIPMFLLLLYLTNKYLVLPRPKPKDPNFILLSSVAVVSFLLPLAKIPWIAAPAAATGILLFHKRYKAAAVPFVSGLLGVIAFVAYGMATDGTLFTNLMSLQLARYDMSFDGIFSLITNPIVTDRLFVDGLPYFGWLAIAMLAMKDHKRHTVVLLGWLAYFGIFLFAIPNEPGHGWYRYPFYPFMAMATAVFLREGLSANPIPMFLFFVTAGLPALQHVWTPVFGFSYAVYRGYLLWSAACLLPLFVPGNKAGKAVRLSNILLLCVVFILTVLAAFGYNEQ